VRLLLTNDDGIDAPGLAALQQVAAEFGEVVVVAPAGAYSGCGHQTTTSKPLQVEQAGAGRFRVYGSPADCVRLALTTLTDNVDWVLAGVNEGGNLGVDTYMSGTVAAAREAAFFGLPAIALSQYRKDRRAPDWEGAVAERTRAALNQLLQRVPEAGKYWNVNFPDPDAAEPSQQERGHKEPSQQQLKESLQLVRCDLERYPLDVAFKAVGQGYQFAGAYQQRRRVTGSDVDVCFGGKISVSLLGHALP